MWESDHVCNTCSSSTITPVISFILLQREGAITAIRCGIQLEPLFSDLINRPLKAEVNVLHTTVLARTVPVL